MRRQFAGLWGGLILAWPAAPALSATDLPAAADLRTEAAAAARQGAPLIVIYSRKDCKYCETVKRDYLKPLAAAAQWEAKNLLIRRQRPGSWLPPPAAAQ